jgi:hypothetical protein
MERREEETHIVRDEPEGTVHEETHVSHGTDPAYDDTRVVSSMAPARRAVDLIYLLYGIIDGLLFIRLLLKAMAANPDVPFTSLVYGITNVFLAPFAGLLPAWASGRSILEPTVIIAIAVYALIAYVLARIVAITVMRNVTVSQRRGWRRWGPGPD